MKVDVAEAEPGCGLHAQADLGGEQGWIFVPSRSPISLAAAEEIIKSPELARDIAALADYLNAGTPDPTRKPAPPPGDHGNHEDGPPRP